jgi:hypothetical protein
MTGWQRWWRRGARTLAVLSTLTAVAVATTVPGAAGAEEGTGADPDETPALPTSYVDAYGWWSKAQQSPTGGGGVPAPACQPAATPATSSECTFGPPADGIYVAYDYQAAPPTATGPLGNAPAPPAGTPQPLGPSAYGAVRFVVPDGAETELSLRFLSKQSSSPGGQDLSVGTLFGCAVTTPGWAGVQNGRYDQAPGYDCTSADQADVVGDTLVFDFPAGMVVNGLLDVAIVGAGDRPFQMAVDRPVDASLVVTNAADIVSTTDDVVSEDVTYEDPIASYEDATAELPLEPSYTGGDVAFSTDEAQLPSVAAPSVRPRIETAVPAGQVKNPLGPDASRSERMMAVGMLLLMGLALWWVGGRPVRAPQLLGSLGNGTTGAVPPAGDDGEQVVAPVGGIGRFIRPRTGKPPRLY